MTVPTTANRVQYNCDGETVEFAFNFPVYHKSNLIVVLLDTRTGVEETLVLDVDYEVSVPGGTVTLIGRFAYNPPDGNYKLTIIREIPLTQLIDLVNGDSMPADVLEEGYDRAVMLIQQLSERIGRSILLPVSSSVTGLTLPVPDPGKILKWNDGGDGFDNVNLADLSMQAVNDYWTDILAAAGSTLAEALAAMGLDPSLATLTLPDNVTVSDFAKTLLDDADADAARATLQIPAASESVAGLAELATQAETDAGTDDARIVTPKKLKESSHLALVSTSAKGLVPTAPDKVYQALRGDGNWGGIPYVLYKSTTTVSISNSNSETTIFSVTVPANMLGTHNMVRVTILGGIVKNAAGVSGIHTWRLKYGSTTVNTWTSPEAGQDSASQYSYKYEGHLFPANGSTSQQRGSWTNCLSRWWTGSNAVMSALVDSPAGEDSTQNKTLSVTFQFNNANANIQFYVYMVLVEVLQ